MAGTPERAVSPNPAPAESAAAFNIPPSPATSARSSDSEGKPVREKLKETRIDAQTSGEPLSDQPMHDAPNANGHATARDNISSGSESGRGRLRRKRSREDFEEDDKDKPVEKKERHVRKKSRDVTSPVPAILEGAESTAKTTVDPIKEHDAEDPVAAAAQPGKSQDASSETRATPEAAVSDKDTTRISPKNKRTHDQTENGDESSEKANVDKGTKAADTAAEEPSAKRPREKSELQPVEAAEESKTKIPPGSGFANASAASPFASLSPKKASSTEKSPQDLPQTSDEKFKSSGFGSFAASSASPFGAIGGSVAKSPFVAAAGGSKLSGFASPPATAAPAASSFGSLAGSSTASGFGGVAGTATGGSVFGGALGQSGFSGLGAPKGGLSSFASPGAGTIVGLSKKPNRPFGAAAAEEEEGSGDEDEGSSDGESSDKEEAEKSKQSEQEKRNFVVQEALETGEEGEDTVWSARAKLYLFRGKDGWQERGAGVVKLNVAQEGPRNPRFILRADGTHRLLLNARVFADLKFGTTEGKQPEDGKLFFAAPTVDGQVLTHLLKMKPENAKALWNEVQGVKAEL